MKQQTLKLAAVGTGGIWGAHERSLSALGGNRIAAVCDVNAENCARVAEKHGARGYADIAAMFAAEPDLDAIIACTPATVRLEVIAAALGKGVPVFVEKPPAFTIAEAREILRVANGASLVVVGFMYRHLPAVDRLRELLAGRAINLTQSSFFCPAATGWKLPGWFYLKERSGGHVLDQAIHVMDLLRFIAGDITAVHTLGNNLIRPKTENFTIEDSSSTVLRYACGASGTHIHSWTHSQFRGELTFIGEDFALTLELDSHLRGYIGDQKVDESFPTPPNGCSHHYEEMKAFLKAVRSGDFSTARSPFADAAKSLATVLAMNESIETGIPAMVGTE